MTSQCLVTWVKEASLNVGPVKWEDYSFCSSPIIHGHFGG